MARTPAYRTFLQMLFAEGAPISEGRRRFIVAGAATAGLTACGSFDRWVLGDNNRLSEEIMVLGGGLAGLAAAYHLKKNKFHYRVYEASARLGGRIQSLQHFNADQQVAELGAEFFEGSHKSLQAYCKDFNLNVQEVSYDPKSDRALYWVKGKVLSERDFRKILKPIAQKLAQARQETFATLATDVTPKGLSGFVRATGVDEKSLADLLSTIRTPANADALDIFETLCVSEWGVDAREINLLQYLAKLDFEERALAAGGNRIFRVEGGASSIISILGERVQGIVANSNLKLEHQLVAVRMRAGGYECTFKTPQGSDVIWARQVICTLPWSVLKDIDGIQGIDIPSSAKQLLSKTKYATHSKVISSFKEATWKKRGSLQKFQGQFRGTLLGQNYWDSSRGQAGARGLMTSLRGGTTGAQTGASAPAETLKDLRNFMKDLPNEESAQVVNWSQKPFSRGSRYNAGPANYLKYLEFLADDSSNSSFYFAGEHLSFKDFGTMNGALETAIAAADRAMQNAYKRS